MYWISRLYSFAAAHRIEGHPKCGRLHGHNYEVIVEIGMPQTGKNGMVLDYGDMDKILKPEIDAFDHRYLVSESNVRAGDTYAALADQKGDSIHLGTEASTAEHLAKLIHTVVQEALTDADILVIRDSIRITVKESAKSSATFSYL